MTPNFVVRPRTSHDVAKIMATATAYGRAVTFRSGGTSLSGQATGRDLLVDVRESFRSIEVLDEGARVRVQGGASLAQINARLRPWKRRLGPDPSSAVACTIGGVVANNSSGMTCGVADNSYHTLDSVAAVLPSGTVLDTAVPDADARLRAAEPQIHEGLLRLRDRIRGDAASVSTISRLFAMKNTMGYALNSFLDYDEPAQILAHLLVGSEGTLAFLSTVTLRTVPLTRPAVTGLLMFPTVESASEALPALVASRPDAVELMDAVSLEVARRDPAAAAVFAGLGAPLECALLVEYSTDVNDEAVVATLAGLVAPGSARIVTLDADRHQLWTARRGIYAAVAAARPAGTTALLEDIAVPVPRLAHAVAGLRQILAEHDYRNAVIFGHAKDGNLHFMITDDFGDTQRMHRFARFTEDLVDLVLGCEGTLKAEHGTGRVMAPFLQRQYGEELTWVMWDLKRLLDPASILNPGVLLTRDYSAHLKDLKPPITVGDVSDTCVECGYCEQICPSRHLSTTPRQRIAVHRAITRADEAGDLVAARQLRKQARFDVEQTCATDGLCATVCPVGIDTGQLVKDMRAHRHGPVAEWLGRAMARHWSLVVGSSGLALSSAQRVPSRFAVAVSSMVSGAAPRGMVPRWRDTVPRGGRRRRAVEVSRPDWVFFPSCMGSIFGSDEASMDLLLTLCRRAGVRVAVPGDIDKLCCGTPWSSKGLTTGHDVMRERVRNAAGGWPGAAGTPTVCDAASCTEGLRSLDDGLFGAGRHREAVDLATFCLDVLLPRLTVHRRLDRVLLHPSCATVKAGTSHRLIKLTCALAIDVVVPSSASCCGFAGDRGLLVPELTASATADEAAEVADIRFDLCVTDNRACEIGLGEAMRQPFVNVLELLVLCTTQ